MTGGASPSVGIPAGRLGVRPCRRRRSAPITSMTRIFGERRQASINSLRRTAGEGAPSERRSRRICLSCHAVGSLDAKGFARSRVCRPAPDSRARSAGYVVAGRQDRRFLGICGAWHSMVNPWSAAGGTCGGGQTWSARCRVSIARREWRAPCPEEKAVRRATRRDLRCLLSSPVWMSKPGNETRTRARSNLTLGCGFLR